MPVITTATTASVTLAANESLTVTASGSIFGASATIFSSALGSNVAIAGAVDISSVQLGGSNLFGVTQSGVVHVSSYIYLGIVNGVTTGGSILSNAGMIISDGGATRMFGNGNLLTNTGSILSENSAVSFTNGSSNQLVNQGLLASRSGHTVDFQTAGGSIDNSGTISSQGGYAVLGFSADMQLTNSGTITSNSSLFNATVLWTSLAGGVTNSGEINGATDYGLCYQLSGTILNSGVITGQVAAVLLTDFAGYLSNSGEIICQTGDAIQVANFNEAGGVTIKNSGTISADEDAFSGSNGADYFINTGTVIGYVGLNQGADTFINRGGTVIGDVAGGAGDDTYRVDGDLNLVELAGDGNDSVFSHASFELAANIENLSLLGASDLDGTGNAERNTLIGNAGDNRLSGLANNDSLSGNAGDDKLLGGLGLDSLLGGDGDDLLRGADSTDTLAGNDGNDTLVGGSGTDAMSGGTGSDVFVLTAWRHAGNTLTSADRITDFTLGDDRVDLSAIDANSTNASSDDAFLFLGSAAFSGAAGQLNVTIDALNNFTYVRLDVDGDSVADSMLRLNGQLSLTAGDFIL